MAENITEIERFAKKYAPSKISLGSGANGSIFACGYKRDKKEPSGLKITYKRDKKKSSEYKFAYKEISISKKALLEVELHFRCSICENVVNVIDVFKECSRLHYQYLVLVMERMNGNLFEKYVEFPEYDEAKKANIMYQICNAVLFLHSNDIAHRDLKFENILLSGASPNFKLKLSDFGLAKICKSGEKALKTPCGTRGYIGPEILQGLTYDKSCDIWSFGVILYVILFYKLPFKHMKIMSPTSQHRIRKGEFYSQDEDTVSRDAMDLIRSLLVPKPTNRFTIEQVIESPWIKNRTSNQGTPVNPRKFVIKDMNTWKEEMSRSVKEKLEEMRNCKPPRNDQEENLIQSNLIDFEDSDDSDDSDD